MALQVPLSGSYSSARKRATPSPCHQHLAVGQQRRRVSTACGSEASGGAPGPAGRVVQFRAGKSSAVDIHSPRHQHFTIGQQRRRVNVACGGEAADDVPSPAGWVVQFRAGQKAAGTDPPATSTLPLDSNVAMCEKREVVRLPVVVQVPLAGSIQFRAAKRKLPLPIPPATSTLPSGSNVAV